MQVLTGRHSDGVGKAVLTQEADPNNSGRYAGWMWEVTAGRTVYASKGSTLSLAEAKTQVRETYRSRFPKLRWVWRLEGDT